MLLRYLRLNVLTLRTELLYHRVQSNLIDGTDRISRKLQGNPFVFFGQVKTLFLQVGQKTTLALDIGVANLVARHRLSSGNLTYSCHDALFFWDGKGAKI
jgi:hypothetical protein